MNRSTAFYQVPERTHETARLDEFIAKVCEDQLRDVLRLSEIQKFAKRQHFMGGDADALVAAMFAEADVKKDGVLDKEEIGKAISGKFKARKYTEEWRTLMRLVLGDKNIGAPKFRPTAKLKRGCGSGMRHVGYSTMPAPSGISPARSRPTTAPGRMIVRTVRPSEEQLKEEERLRRAELLSEISEGTVDAEPAATTSPRKANLSINNWMQDAKGKPGALVSTSAVQSRATSSHASARPWTGEGTRETGVFPSAHKSLSPSTVERCARDLISLFMWQHGDIGCATDRNK
jgi:hypothetical protein